MDLIQVRLFGPPEITYQNQRVNISRQIPRWLLYYLAGQENPVTRDTIIDLFWPEIERNRGRARLREELSRLKAALPLPEAILATPELIEIDTSLIFVDLRYFQQVLREISLPLWTLPVREPLPPVLAQKLSQAASLWRGNSLLEGAKIPNARIYDDWLTSTNAYLQDQRRRILRRLAEHMAASGRPQQAVEYLEEAFSLDNLDESLAAELIRRRLALGQRAKALETYQKIVHRLEEELGIPPGPELLSIGTHLAEPNISRLEPKRLAINLHPTLELPLIGQQKPLQTLEQKLETGGLVIIRGSTGSGKSRLLTEFAHRIEQRAKILLVRCLPTSSMLPFQPLADTLRTMIAPEDWLALPVPWLTYLAFWLPELQVFVRVGEPPVEIFSHQFYSLLQEAIRQLLENISKHQKLVLIVDDLQYADEATVNTLVYLCERPPFSLGSLMLLSTRMEDPNPHLTAWLPVLSQTQRFRQIQIPGLSREEVISLCTLAFREPISTILGEQLHQMTQGNPYFVLETIRSMLEQGISPHDLKPNQPLPVPDTIKQLLWSRLQQVSMAASHYLAAAAVFGRQFPIQTVGEIVDLSRTQIAQALEELELRALLIPVENNPEQRQFAHDQIRETLLEHIHPSRQQALHELVFYALLEQQKKDVLPIAGLLAQHAEQAGLWSQAFDHYVLAGKNGYRTFALEETIRAYERADLMIDQFGQRLSDQQIYDLYSEWNDLAFELDRPDLVETLNKRLLILGKQRNSPLLIGVALDGLSDYCMALNKFEAGLDYTNQALDYIQQVDNPFEYTEIMMHKGVFLYMLNRLAEAEQTFGTARNSISRSNDAKSQRSRSSLFYHLAILNTLIGKPAVARLYAMASLKHGRLSKYPHNIISAYAALVFTSHFAGMYHEGLQYAASGIEYARQHKAWRMLAYLHGYQSMIQLVCGQLDDAFASAQQARQSAQHHNHHEIIAFSYRLEGDIHLSMGNVELAKEQYLACLHHGKDSFWGLDGLSRLGIAQIRSGSPDIGQEFVRETIQLADKSGLRLVSLITRAALAESLLDLGKTAEAKQLASEVLEACQKTCLPAVWIGVNAVLGNCASRELDKPAAKFYLTRAFDHNDVLQDCWLEVILLMHIKQSSQWLSEIVVPEQKFARRIENLKAHLLQTTTRPDFKDAIHALSGKLAIS